MTTLWPFADDALDVERFPRAKPLVSGLERAVQRGTLPATLLLVGEPLAGREAVAVELAAMLVCPQPKAGCTCGSCQRVRHGIHPDLHILRPEPGHRDIRVEDVAEVLASFQQVPYEGRKRVYVLTNAHTPPLNVFAASALLKTLEEPVSHAHWILLAANPLRVLPTIVSRAVSIRVPAGAEAFPGQTHDKRTALLLAEVPASAGALAEEGAEGEAFLGLAQELLPEALAGDLLALLRLAALAKDRPWRSALLAALTLTLARRLDSESAERVLRVAEGWLAAQHVQEQLHLGLEATVLAVLGPMVSEGQ
ncbi:MAG: hypothetical protein ACP5NF_09575 [Thermoanaerobaculum sp.]